MKNIILCTDIGADADDVGALALLNTFLNNKKINVLAIVNCTSNPYALSCIEIINNYYGNNIPLGRYEGKEFLPNDSYAKEVSIKFPNHNYNKIYLESLTLIKRILLSKEDNSITLISIGQLNVFSNLLKQVPNLFNQKIKECIVMGGYFNKPNKPLTFEGNVYNIEFNIQCDIEAAKYFIDNCRCKIVFIDFMIGYLCKTMAQLLKEDDISNPITYAYKVYNKGPRESWDLLAVYYACIGLGELFIESNKGVVKVLDNGETLFNEDNNGLHTYLLLKNTGNKAAEIIDNLIINNLPERKKLL